MDLAPVECRKSLDQLLEQAMAERSREDDGVVEVTYEMTGSQCDEGGRRKLRPKPSNEDASSNSKDKEGDEEDEDTIGSIRLEKKAIRNAIILSMATIFLSSGFFTLQSLQSSLFQETGLQSLAILYIFASISCMYAPIIVQKVEVKGTIATVSLLLLLYIIAFHYYNRASWIAISFVLGLGFGPMVRAQKTYLSRNISRLSYVTQVMRTKIQQRYLRYFFFISKSSYFWGHLVATIIMEFTGSVDDMPLNATESPTTVVRHTELCYERLCKDEVHPMDRDSMMNQISLDNSMPRYMSKIFVYVFASCIALGALMVVVGLERIEVLYEQDPMERPLIHQTIRQIKLILIDKNVRLTLPMLIFIGIEQAFIFGDFTRAYISCALGLQSVAFTMTCFGGAHTLGSIGVNLFSQHFQRPIIMAAGLVCQSGLLMVLWLWTPDRDDAAVFYVIAGGWGLCNAMWETLTLTFIHTTYPDDWTAPFCTYYQMQWLGMGLTFAVSPYLCAEVKILILAMFLAVAIIPYSILEFRLHQRTLLQDRTEML
ncbi:hypothetical protein JTE90_001565 [Oedothorax gibbosus]|uniref:UNC93-like protein n=1 Tax=Oedothorax gibbosus TaxID=931172 RepID=A0AAV6VMB8_9ARAC|nr:hypothetical protein JTE90_001565 [Oedothorax gibbosus]